MIAAGLGVFRRRPLKTGLVVFLVMSGSVFGGPGISKGRARGGVSDEIIIVWNGFRIDARNAALLATPGSDQFIRFSGKSSAPNIRVLECKGEGWCKKSGPAISYQAPSESGNYRIEVKLGISSVVRSRGAGRKSRKIGGGKERVINLKIACLVGFSSSLLDKGFLNGFELGEYPDGSKKKNPDYYKPPAYFYFLDYDVIGCSISEHIKLGDLGYDGRAPIPQYFALDYELVRKLELLIDELNARDLPSRYHFIGGGFISPKSNILRTSKTAAAAKTSRHLWGEAIDFMIDEYPLDETMDDMNRDGVIDVRDAFEVRDIITKLEDSGRCVKGGIGVYSPPRNSDIQLHVDVRGFQTRWGYKKYDPEIFAGQTPKRSMRPGG